MVLAQSYDVAMNMLGIYKRVQTIISESIVGKIICIPFCTHRSNKVIEHSTQNNLETTKFFDLCNKIYVFITGSKKCCVTLCKIYAALMNDDIALLIKLTDTH